MPIALEVTLIAVLLALAAGLVPLLFQLRRTARAVDAFLLTSSRDLTRIAEDVHASRVRMDALAASLQVSLDELSGFAGTVGELGRTVKALHARYHNALESASGQLGGLIGGIRTVLSFFKDRPASPPPE